MPSTYLDPDALIPWVLRRYSPVVVERGVGTYVYGNDGQRYLDFTSGIAVTNTGRCHPFMVKAIQAPAAKIIHAQANILVHAPYMQRSHHLSASLPESLDGVFFANSGAEAIQGAIKLAKVVTRRPAVTAFRGLIRDVLTWRCH